MNQIEPMPGLILVEPLPEEELKGAFRSPTSAQTLTKRALVLAVGPATTNEFGTPQPILCKVNDIILHRQYGPEPFRWDGKELKIIRFQDVVATERTKKEGHAPTSH